MFRSFSASARLAVAAAALLLIAAGLAWLLGGEARQSFGASHSDPPVVLTATAPGPSAPVQGVDFPNRSRLTLEAAEAQVRAYIFSSKPGMNPAAQFPLAEMTAEETWQRMGVQVYQVTEGVQQYQTYVIADGVVYPIGESFGGLGVHTLIVTDLDQDGAAELVFAYSFGSGLSQSRVGLLYPTEHAYLSGAAENFHYLGHLRLEKLDDSAVRVLANDSGEPLGVLRLVDGRLVVASE